MRRSVSRRVCAASLTSGYHLAFTIGAVCVAVGTLVALVLLREPRAEEPELVIESERLTPAEPAPELERQAA